MERDRRRAQNAFVSVYELHALRRNGGRMRTMRRSGRGIRCGYGEVVEAALDRIAARVRGVVLHHVARKCGASGHASGLVGPFRFARSNGNIAKPFACVTTSLVTGRTSVRAMQGCIGHRRTRVINAAAERIAGRVGIHTRRESCGRGHTASIARILRICSSAVGLHVATVFLCSAH